MNKKKTITINNTEIELTNLEKILFPKSKITKKDLIEYYHLIFPLMLPFIKDRPITMFRYPNGINQGHFVQKNASEFFPKWVKTVSIAREKKENIKMVVCNDAQTLVYLANLACITPHIWLSCYQKLTKPNRLIFDLDPSGAKFEPAVEAAVDLKEILEKEYSLSSYVMTTGSKGLHVIIPIIEELSFDDVKSFAKKIAFILVEKRPDLYTTEMRKEKRGKKLFIDYHRNAYAQTAVAPYAVRAIEGAPVATPIEWGELTKINAQSYNIKTILKRLNNKKIWGSFFKKKYSLKKMI